MSELTKFLQRSVDNRGVLAALRQGLVEATEIRAWPWLARFGGIGHTLASQAVRTVAGLFAHHPCPCDTGNMGDSCRELCDPDESPGNIIDGQGQSVSPGPMSRKFSWMMAANREEICARVIRMVLYAKSKGVPINYEQLEKDLSTWPRARENWASAFWGVKKTDTERGTYDLAGSIKPH